MKSLISKNLMTCLMGSSFFLGIKTTTLEAARSYDTLSECQEALGSGVQVSYQNLFTNPCQGDGWLWGTVVTRVKTCHYFGPKDYSIVPESTRTDNYKVYQSGTPNSSNPRYGCVAQPYLASSKEQYHSSSNPGAANGFILAEEETNAPLTSANPDIVAFTYGIFHVWSETLHCNNQYTSSIGTVYRSCQILPGAVGIVDWKTGLPGTIK